MASAPAGSPRGPLLSADQVRQLDALVESQFGIPAEWLMQMAGWQTARLAARLGRRRGRIVVVCGKGNNGGDGLAAARFLHNWDRLDKVVLSHSAEALGELAKRQLDILRRLGVGIEFASQGVDLHSAGLIIDALLGVGSRGAPRGESAQAIREIMASGRPVLALDIPSGVDCDSGTAFEPCISAQWTLTLGALKPGLTFNRKHVGRVYLADIGIPNPALATVDPTGQRVAWTADLVAVT